MDSKADKSKLEASSVETSPVESSPEDREPMLYCPVCSRRLLERTCKLVCEQCGYFMSCSDYY